MITQTKARFAATSSGAGRGLVRTVEHEKIPHEEITRAPEVQREVTEAARKEDAAREE